MLLQNILEISSVQWLFIIVMPIVVGIFLIWLENQPIGNDEELDLMQD